MIPYDAFHESSTFHHRPEFKIIRCRPDILCLHVIIYVSQIDLFSLLASLIQHHVDVDVAEGAGWTLTWVCGGGVAVALRAVDVVMVRVAVMGNEWEIERERDFVNKRYILPTKNIQTVIFKVL